MLENEKLVGEKRVSGRMVAQLGHTWGAWVSIALSSCSPEPQSCASMGHACLYLGWYHRYWCAGAWLYLLILVFLQQPYDYTVITMTLLLGTANSTIIKKFISKSSWKLINFTAVSILSHCNKEKLSSRQIKSKLIALGESIQISLFHVRNLFLKQEEES